MTGLGGLRSFPASRLRRAHLAGRNDGLVRVQPLNDRAPRFADLLDKGRGRPGLRRAAAERVDRPPARRRRVSGRNQLPPQPRRHAPQAGSQAQGRCGGRQGKRVKTGVSP